MDNAVIERSNEWFSEREVMMEFHTAIMVRISEDFIGLIYISTIAYFSCWWHSSSWHSFILNQHQRATWSNIKMHRWSMSGVNNFIHAPCCTTLHFAIPHHTISDDAVKGIASSTHRFQLAWRRFNRVIEEGNTSLVLLDVWPRIYQRKASSVDSWWGDSRVGECWGQSNRKRKIWYQIIKFQ